VKAPFAGSGSQTSVAFHSPHVCRCLVLLGSQGAYQKAKEPEGLFDDLLRYLVRCCVFSKDFRQSVGLDSARSCTRHREGENT
jgi:hypothetical protein